MTLTQQWWHVNLTRNSFCILFPAKGIVSFRQIISSLRLKRNCSLPGQSLLTLWRPAGFGDFRKKKRLNARGFAREFLRSGMLFRPGKSLKRCSKSSSLHSKKKFLLGGCGFFVSGVISGRLLGHFAWPGRQPLSVVFR